MNKTPKEHQMSIQKSHLESFIGVNHELVFQAHLIDQAVVAGRHFNSKGVDYNILALPHHLAILHADEVYVAQSPETDDGDGRRWTGFTHLPDNG